MTESPSPLSMLLSRHTRRREFIAGLAGAAAVLPFTAQAQQPAQPVVGFLHAGSHDKSAFRVAAVRRGLAETGYTDGRNVAIEYRWAENQYDQLPALAAELVRRQVAVIAALGGDRSVLAAKAATRTIPIVFNTGNDPVTSGLVASLNRPGGNITGVSTLNIDVAAKRLQLLHELVPTAAVIALLINPANPESIETETKELQGASRALGLRLLVVNATTEAAIDTAFATLTEQQADAVFVVSDQLFTSRRNQIVALAARHAVPAIYQFREFAAAGGLMSYGSNLADTYRQAGVYTGKILKGAAPADLPVEQVTKIEFVINLKVAKALGLTVPTSILLRANEVIE
jgi:putative tryptophan/tyrosine transport system substrate-binding protein